MKTISRIIIKNKEKEKLRAVDETETHQSPPLRINVNCALQLHATKLIIHYANLYFLHYCIILFSKEKEIFFFVLSN